jgi:EmrB/QacA subfamily drug resistance transporter
MVTSAEVVGSRRWIVLGVLCLATTTLGVDTTILAVALPSIVRDLHTTGAELQWILDAYIIVFAGLLLTTGALGDRLGRRRTLLAGLAGFVLFSVLAGTADSPARVIVARGLMGMAAACIYPTTLSIITNVFHEPAERSRAIATWAGVSAIGLVLGPLLGGFLIEHFDWHAVFWINVPVSGTGFVLAALFVPTTPRSPHRLDPLGALLSIASLVVLLWGIIRAPEAGWTDVSVLGSLAVAVALLVGFARWESVCRSPMLPLSFFRNPRFSAASATVTIITFGMMATMFVLTQYFQFVQGYSPLEAGLMMIPVAIGIIGVSPFSHRFVRRFGTKRVVVTGVGIILVATFGHMSDTIMSTFATGFVARLLYGLGIGLMMPTATESIMGSLPPERSGVGSAVNDATRQVGGALGIAVLGSVFVDRYHTLVDHSDLPPEVRVVARESIGTTMRLAHDTADAGLAARIEDVGMHAFLLSMRPVFLLTASITVVAGWVAWRFLPARATPMAHRVDSELDDEVDEALLTGVERAIT